MQNTNIETWQNVWFSKISNSQEQEPTRRSSSTIFFQLQLVTQVIYSFMKQETFNHFWIFSFCLLDVEVHHWHFLLDAGCLRTPKRSTMRSKKSDRRRFTASERLKICGPDKWIGGTEVPADKRARLLKFQGLVNSSTTSRYFDFVEVNFVVKSTTLLHPDILILLRWILYCS